jgi:hypothetical protein
MALFLPKDIDGPSWLAFEEFLARTKHGAEIFRAVRTRTTGLIIAYWEDETKRAPTHYLDRLKFFGTSMAFFTDFSKFGDETEAEDPHQYKTLRGALRTVIRYRQEISPRIGLIYWVHPEAGDVLNDKYVRLTEADWVSGNISQ